MTSEIRVNKLTNRIGLSTVTFADSGIGVTVTGRIDPDTDSARDLGTTSVRWRNAYVDTYYGDGSNLTGITVPGGATNLDLLDSSGTGNGRIRLGASQDLQIYHDGSHSWFKNTEGRLILQTDGDQLQLRGATVKILNGAGNSTYASVDTNNHLLYTAGIERFRVWSDGVVSIGQSSKSSTVGAGGLDIQGNSTNCIIEMGNPFPGFSGGVVPEFRITATNSSHEVKFESVWGGDNALHPHLAFAGGSTIFYNGMSTTEVARFNSDKLGIGTDTPAGRLEVTDAHASVSLAPSGNTSFIDFKANKVAQAGQIKVSESSGGGAVGFFNKNTSGVLRECFRLSPTWRTVSFFQSGPSYPAGPSHDEQYFQFCNSFAYNYIMRMRNLTWGYGLRIDVDDDSTREGLLIFSTKSGVNQSKASIHMDGTYRSRNNTYTSFSDIKLKENIVDAGSQWDDIKGLKVRNFNFKIDDPSQKMIGVIAQEAETVCPNLVRDIPDTEEKDGEIHETGTYTKEVKYSILYMKAIKALQEAMERIEKLEQDNIALRARVTNLEGN